LAKLLFGGGDADEAGFPFELLGISALLIFSAMAFTSHDYWLHRFTPRVWKALHMAVYAAYALIVVHVILGKLSSESGMEDTLYASMVMAGAIALVALHVGAAVREHRIDKGLWPMVQGAAPERWIDAGLADDIPEGRAKIVSPPDGERIAVFRHEGTVCAVANVCSHQNGPLGEGCIIDGLITCPWHGYQFKLHDGCAPEPYTDRIATYRVRLEGRRVFVDPTPQPLGASNPQVRLPG
jgi:nitrite reductase/ring-hydroxylating ferredoxin subunit